jgi:hypothetical protein
MSSTILYVNHYPLISLLTDLLRIGVHSLFQHRDPLTPTLIDESTGSYLMRADIQ